MNAHVSDERRRSAASNRGPGASVDSLCRAVTLLGVMAWGLLILSLLMLGHARPEELTFFDRVMTVVRRRTWDAELMRNSLIVLFASLAAGAAGVIFDTLHEHADHGHHRRTLVLAVALALLTLGLRTVLL